MKGRDNFTAKEATQIRAHLRALRKAEPGVPQKLIRDQLRAIGFYITDWPRDSSGFTASDFDDLVLQGQITVHEQGDEGPVARRESRADERVSLRSRPKAPRAAPTPAHVPGVEFDELVARALDALGGDARSLIAAVEHIPDSPGLYAIYGSEVTWEELGLGKPPDARPLYVGKAEDSLVTRDLATHFGDGRTGSSTVRRSFAALLHDSLGLHGIPRNQENPGYYANYGLTSAHDTALTAWMRRQLKLAVWLKPPGADLLAIERGVLALCQPPLNLKDVSTPWSAPLSAARRRMAEEARAWARERGFDA